MFIVFLTFLSPLLIKQLSHYSG